MKIRLKEQFKKDFKRVQCHVKDPQSFVKSFCRAVYLLERGKDLSKEFAFNRLIAKGEGWHDCYVFEDIVMIYKVQGQYVRLSRIGTCEELYEEQ